MRKYFLLFIVVLAYYQVSMAQDQTEYQNWVKKQEEEFKDFKDARDKEFLQFLRLEWKQMRLSKGLVQDVVPKPPKPPVYLPSGARPEGVPIETPNGPRKPGRKPTDILQEQTSAESGHESDKGNVPPVRASPISKDDANPVPGFTSSETPIIAPKFSMFFDYYGTRTSIGHNISQKPMLEGEPNKESIGVFWAGLSRTDYEILIDQMESHRKRMGLNDWGYCQLLYQWGKQIYSGRQNEAVLITWFLLSKSGFDARVGYSGGRIYLLLPTSNNLFYVSYFTIGKEEKRYYAIPLETNAKRVEGALFSYDGSYPGAEHQTDFSVKNTPILADRVGEKRLTFEYDGSKHSIQVAFNRDAVTYFENYPQTNFEVYFTSTPSPEAIRTLVAGLKPIVSGKSELEATNILLRFVQTAFEYQTDQEQFGREKPFFPEETIYYPYSDCEDRAILFAYLIRTLLGLDVVGLDYPAHIATAVLFKSKVAGDGVIFKGRRYVICDPTFINANAGACMPSFKTVTPNIIQIESKSVGY